MIKVLWRLGRSGPSVVASTLLILLVVPALPTVAQVVVFYGGLLVVVMLVFGIGERPAVRVLTRARTLTDVERSVLAPITVELCRHGLGPPVTEFYVARSPANVPAARSGQLPQDQAVAMIAHAALVARSGLSRQTLTVAFWTLPWRSLCAIARPLRRLLPEFVWKARFVVFAVAIWQSAMTGPPIVGPISATVLTVILATSYLSPACTRRWHRHVAKIADNRLIDLGLGTTMATFLRRYPQTQELEARLDALELIARPAPRLHLVK